MKISEGEGPDAAAADLLERLQQGDVDAFAPLVRRDLPPHLGRLIDERYRHERTAAQIAAQWVRTQQWVRVTLFRVRRQLRACLEAELAGGSHAT